MMRIALALAACSGVAAQNEYVNLYNAAAPGQQMPAIGLGTGGYGTTHNAYGAYPECWMEIVGCGNYTITAVKQWLAVGGRRLDGSDSYDTQYSVGVAIAQSDVDRSSLFVTSKTGNWNPCVSASGLPAFCTRREASRLLGSFTSYLYPCTTCPPRAAWATRTPSLSSPSCCSKAT
jgi:hypothetical protein